MFRRIKEFIQRGKRGYSDSDWYGFNSYLTDIIIPNIRKLKGNAHGCPGDLWDESAKNNEIHKWTEILEEIAQGFEAAKFLDSYGYHKWVDVPNGKKLEVDIEAITNAYNKLTKGMELFGKYYINLWD